MNEDDSLDAFCESLKSLKPARQQLDVRQVFYSAGLSAAGVEVRRTSAYSMIRFLAAMFVGLVLGAPFAYHVGQSRVLMPQDGVAEAIPNDATNTDPISEKNGIERSAPAVDNESAVDHESTGSSSTTGTRDAKTERSQLASAFASWLDLNEGGAATSTDRSTNRTLTAFHGSLIRAGRGDLSDFPSPMIRSSFAFESQQDLSEDADQASRSLEAGPLAVGDRQWVFSNLEESR
ncbi:MAG: hypothetical protein AAGG48_02695 [Planctomycetota bacterium]